jgi:bifunctional isochorismate lyase/aryl carrier protein
MALPQSVSYMTPRSDDLPRRRAGWTLDPSRAALLVHDMQRYFVRPFAAECPALTGAVDSIAALIAAARAAGVPVAYTAQPGSQDPASRGLLTDLWGPGLRDDEADTAILDVLAPAPGDAVFTKHRYSAFARAPFQDWLDANGRSQLLITGIYAHIGVSATAVDAFMRDIQPFVVADAVADFSAEEHRRALETVASTCGVVCSAADALAALQAAPPGDGWDRWLDGELQRLLVDPDSARLACADPASDLFALGLDSLRAFALLDQLADRGIEVDFTEFVGEATVGFLRRQIARSGVTGP